MSIRMQRELNALEERVKKLEEALAAQEKTEPKRESHRSLLSLRNRTATSDVL